MLAQGVHGLVAFCKRMPHACHMHVRPRLMGKLSRVQRPCPCPLKLNLRPLAKSLAGGRGHACKTEMSTPWGKKRFRARIGAILGDSAALEICAPVTIFAPASHALFFLAVELPFSLVSHGAQGRAKGSISRFFPVDCGSQQNQFWGFTASSTHTS